MSNKKDQLWPFNKAIAIVATPIIWILFAVIFSLTQNYLQWPPVTLYSEIIIITIILSFIPLALVLLDFLSSRGAVIGTKWGTIDFSKVDLSQQDIRRESFGLPDNIGLTGPIISDTAPMDIINTLERATKNEIVVINLKDGNAWWVTRLLALSTGAIRAGSPKVFVFVGLKENISNSFLGWGKPQDIQEAILNDREDYKTRYNKSMQIAKQVLMFSEQNLIPIGITLSHDVARYTGDFNYIKLGEAVTEQILMDQLVISYGYNMIGSLEMTPDKLTLGRLRYLFEHCLYTEQIDLNWPNDEQIGKLLNSLSSYLALVRNNQFVSMLKREDGERLILKELFNQYHLDNKKEK